MLNKPSKRVISAFTTLEGNSDFESVMDWIRESLENLKSANAEAREEYLVRWGQGAIQALGQINEYSKNSRDILKKF